MTRLFIVLLFIALVAPIGATQSLVIDKDTIASWLGGEVNFSLDAGALNQGRYYVMFGSLSGSSPGTLLPGGNTVLPINWDFFSGILISLNLPGFMGNLDGSGTAGFKLVIPPGIQLTNDLIMTFAYALVGPPWDFASNAVDLRLRAAPAIIYVDDSNNTGIEDGSMAHPFNTIIEGVAAADYGDEVKVDDSGLPYVDNVFMKSGVWLHSENWDTGDGSNRAHIDPPDLDNTWPVYFDNVYDAVLEGFKIGFTRYNSSFGTEMVGISGGKDNSIVDCYFTGTTDCYYATPIYATGSEDLVVAHCRMSGIDKDIDPNGCSSFSMIRADMCPGIVVRNTIMTDLRSSSDSTGKNFDLCVIEGTQGVSLFNNLIHHVKPLAQLSGAILGTGFRLVNCSDVEVSNNTVDNIDVTDAFFIQQIMCFWFENCSNVEFTNNIITNIYCNGFPPGLGRGVQAVNCTVVCDYTDIWTVDTPYFQGASPGVGAISADPQYFNPINEDYEIASGSPAQAGDPLILDWDDMGSGGSRMGCTGGPGGEFIGLLTPW